MDTIKKVIAEVRATISRYRMIDPGDRLIVAVSGGPDSMCLLDILHRLKEELSIHLLVAHFDHGMRPGEDAEETETVRGIACSMGLPFETEKCSLSIKKGGGSTEEKARDARYAFLERIKERHSANKIAVAHTLNDQAETVLMRLLRGTGPSGLAGIPYCREGKIIRPLLETHREDVEEYLKARGLPWVSDSSNLNTGYLRNRIRLELVPLLLKYQPKIVRHLGEMASNLMEENECLDTLSGEWLKGASEVTPDGGISVRSAPLLALPTALRKRAIRRILLLVKGDMRRIGRGHIHSVDGLAGSERVQGSLDLPGGVKVRRVYDRLCFSTRNQGLTPAYIYLMEAPGTLHLPEVGRSLTVREWEGQGKPELPVSPWVARLDADRVAFPVVVRNSRPGDRFVPLGMKGHKKLQDFFVDHKVPLDQRAATPLLLSGNEIVWVCGYRIDDRFKITSSTKKVLEITLR